MADTADNHPIVTFLLTALHFFFFQESTPSSVCPGKGREGKGEILISLNKSRYLVPLGSDSLGDGSVAQFQSMKYREGSLGVCLESCFREYSLPLKT